MRSKATVAAAFSAKEIRIIELLAREYTTKAIAPQVRLSLRTVETYRSRLLKKSGSVSTVGLVVYALQKKLIQLDKLRKHEKVIA